MTVFPGHHGSFKYSSIKPLLSGFIDTLIGTSHYFKISKVFVKNTKEELWSEKIQKKIENEM